MEEVFIACNGCDPDDGNMHTPDRMRIWENRLWCEYAYGMLMSPKDRPKWHDLPTLFATKDAEIARLKEQNEALNRIIDDKDAEIARLQKRVAELEAALELERDQASELADNNWTLEEHLEKAEARAVRWVKYDFGRAKKPTQKGLYVVRKQFGATIKMELEEWYCDGYWSNDDNNVTHFYFVAPIEAKSAGVE